jgi:formamidase
MGRVVAQPPNAENVHAGSGGPDIKEKVGKEGARTIPGRPEHGGNVDIKNLSRGSKVFLPVHVKGAKFSVGDLHFSRQYPRLSPPTFAFRSCGSICSDTNQN